MIDVLKAAGARTFEYFPCSSFINSVVMSKLLVLVFGIINFDEHEAVDVDMKLISSENYLVIPLFPSLLERNRHSII